MQGFMNGKGLVPNDDPLAKIGVGELAERPEQRRPSLVPLLPKLVVADLPLLELRLPLTPRLLAVGGEEVGEARLEVARDVPHKDGYGVSLRCGDVSQLIARQLLEGPFGKALVSTVLALNRPDDFPHPAHLSWSPQRRESAAAVTHEENLAPKNLQQSRPRPVQSAVSPRVTNRRDLADDLPVALPRTQICRELPPGQAVAAWSPESCVRRELSASPGRPLPRRLGVAEGRECPDHLEEGFGAGPG